MCTSTRCWLNDYLVYTLIAVLGYMFYYNLRETFTSKLLLKHSDNSHLLRHWLNINLAQL